MAKTHVHTSGVQIVEHDSDGKNSAPAPSAGQPLVVSGSVLAKNVVVHGDLYSAANTHVIFDNPA